jgi:methionyl-tRNA synthetase
VDCSIGIFVAWPYANGDVHLGHVAGAYLPADIFARYHRLRGNRVLMVSGSDTHGTPITVQATRLGIAPQAVFQHYHQRFLDSWHRLGISFDLFTHTDTQNHDRVAQDIFRRLYEKGYILPGATTQPYCSVDRRFLPDRYVEGTCPHCAFPRARGDQCDNCGRLLDAFDLVDPRCVLCGRPPEPRETEQLFLDLPAFQQRLLEYIAVRSNWRPNVRHFVRNYVGEGLLPRAVTRDIEWGIPVPVAGYERKVMYVWFEAVIGYLSASIEWAVDRGTPDDWKTWWLGPDARAYYFIGKDNIPFHAIIWPAQLMGYDDRLILPYDIPANEFLNLEGKQFSTSRHWAIWLPDYLDRYEPDVLRHYLTAIAPDTADSEFTWQGYVERTNNELVATWGNLVHRVLSFAHRHWEGHVPPAGPFDQRDRTLLATLESAFAPTGDLYASTRFKAAVREIMALAREVNRYLDDKGPWFQIKTDRDLAGTTIFVALQAIDSLKMLFAPVLPFSSELLHRALGYHEPLFGVTRIEQTGTGQDVHHVLRYRAAPAEGRVDRWRPGMLPGDHAIEQPPVLFRKLDPGMIAAERERLVQAEGGEA